MNPNSSYDLLYYGLSETDRERLQQDIAAVLKKGAEEVQGMLTREVEKSMSAMYSQLMANPWPTVVLESGNQYEFMEAIRKSIWDAMKESSPAKVSEWPMRELLAAWKEKFPEDWNAAIGEDAARRIKTLEEQLDFERRVRQRQ